MTFFLEEIHLAKYTIFSFTVLLTLDMVQSR